MGKENANKNEASFLDLDIKIKPGKFHFGLFDKRDSIPFSTVRMPGKSSNVPSSIVYSAIGAESLRISRARNIHWKNKQLCSKNFIQTSQSK